MMILLRKTRWIESCGWILRIARRSGIWRDQRRSTASKPLGSAPRGLAITSNRSRRRTPSTPRRRTRWAARLTYLGLLAAPVVFSMIILNRKTSWFTVEERMRYDGSGTYPRNIYTPKHISHWYFVALGGAFIWIMLTLLCVLQLEPGPGEKVDEGEDAAWVPARDVKKIAPLPYESDMSCDESALSGDDASHRKSSEWDKRHRRRIAGTKVLPTR